MSKSPSESNPTDRAGGWGAFDFANPPIPSLAPGDYPGVIASVHMADKDDTLWMIVSFRLDGHMEVPDSLLGVIAAREGSPHRGKVGEGYRLLNRLAKAALADLKGLKDAQEIPDRLTGRPLLLRIGHRKRDGVASLVVQRLLPIV